MNETDVNASDVNATEVEAAARAADPVDQATGGQDADLWAQALAEQAATEQAATEQAATEQAATEQASESESEPDAAASQAVQVQTFPAIDPASADNTAASATRSAEKTTPLALTDMELIADIPVQLSVELGRTRMTIKQILQLGRGSVIELDSLAGQPMDIYINGYLIAQGEVVVVDERYGIRLTDIITPAERLSRLNGRR